MSEHHVYFPDLRDPLPLQVVLSGPEAHHAARVKRLEVGAAVRLCNGQGLLAAARVADVRKVRGEWEVVLDGPQRLDAPRVRPRLDVYAAAPKGERLEELIDGLSQVGAAAWRPLLAVRTVVEPRAAKLQRLERVAVESLKQSGRAWLLEIGEPLTFQAALASAPRVVVADGSGEPYAAVGADHIALLIGPEGGWAPAELGAAREAGATIARFGPHIMRVEVAAVVASAVVIGDESRRLAGQ